MAEIFPTIEQIVKLDQWLLQQGFSPRLSVTEAARCRCGLYALRMLDDWVYIGQTINFANRMRNHLSRFAVASVQFLEVPADELDQREEGLIYGLQNVPFPFTYNKSYVSFPYNRGILTEYLTKTQEDLFLSGVPTPFSTIHRDNSLMRHKTKNKFELIRSWPHIEIVIATGRYYIKNCIPEPAMTEGILWMMSCLPYYESRKNLPLDYAGTIFRINIFRQEIFFVDSDGEAGFWATGFLSPSVLEAAWPERDTEDEALLAAAPSFQWADRFWASGGGDQQSFSVTVNDLVPLLELPPVLRAVRRFVVGLARKGTVWWQQSHCPSLADLFLKT